MNRAAIAATTCLVAAAGPAGAQPLWDSFDQYSASPQGEPLAGQGEWTLPTGAEAGWDVYTFGDNPFGLAPPFGSTQFAAGGGLGVLGQAEAQRQVVHSESVFRLTARLAVRFVSRPPPATTEIGRIAVAPHGGEPGAALIARWSDTSSEVWSVDLLRYDAAGEQQVSEVFTDLRATEWYELAVRLDLVENRVERVTLKPPVGEEVRRSSPDWYLSGGAAGGPEPDTILLTAGRSGASGNVLAVDIVEPLSGWCNIDCDQSGHIDFFDFLCFQTGFVVGAPWADCDGNGEFDVFDFLCYQNKFAHGCGP